ncbi:Hypothetical predicted protein [Mytilus galloprovincialis]|uniref:Uncharacterized protein n=1 Tax=Mytilus galloprovincialis TaxID=29158 RepID=A0A8B6CM99_MYTGA|nr:Hypothetical predicted protein [Mytilus galloprovincialis]
MSPIRKMYAAVIILMLSNLIVCRPIDFRKVKDRPIINWDVFSFSVFGKLQLKYVLCILATYFVFTLLKEQLTNSKLLKEMRVLHNLKKHGQWQIDESNDEMNALLWRLQNNRTIRTQDILIHLQRIFNKQDERHYEEKKLAQEIDIWKTTINDNTIKLKKDKTVAVEKIQRTGLYAAERINKTSENLHRQISIARDILENSSRLMDLKGLPMNCNNGNSHEL